MVSEIIGIQLKKINKSRDEPHDSFQKRRNLVGNKG